MPASPLDGTVSSRNAPSLAHCGLKSAGNARIREAYKAYVDSEPSKGGCRCR